MLAQLTVALAALTAPLSDPTRPATTIPDPNDLIARWVRASSDDRPRINVWVNKEDAYQRGDRARVYFKTDRDAYVTIVRIDTDGRVRVLFPIDPWEDSYARADRTFEVLGRDDDEAFRVDDYPGVGYIFAIASTDEFDYDEIVRGDHWDYRNISDGRVRGDPYVAVSDLAERIAHEGDFDYDVSEYYVEKHYDYPRFVCYDCHTYATYRYWDPYGSYCSRFRIVIYDDWYYYPYRRYGGGGVYYGGRPYRPGPRYVFKDTDPRNDYITRVANRPREEPTGPRRPPEGRTSADVGGRGSIPTPRRRVGQDGQPQLPGGGSQSEPRRRIEGSRPSTPGTIDDTPDRNDPRRRMNPDGNSGQPNITPSVPGNNDRPGNEQPRRRGIEERDNAKPRNDDQPSRRRTSEGDDKRTPVTREPRSSDRDRSEPRRAPERSEPRAEPRSQPRSEPREQPRSEPKREPERRAEPQRAPERRAEPQREQPRSTGEPSLKRRRPN
jgi:hypothetical protein